jgi:hypothetical protein
MVIAQKALAISMFENFVGNTRVARGLAPAGLRSGPKTDHNLAALQNIHFLTFYRPCKTRLSFKNSETLPLGPGFSWRLLCRQD